jgi:hypothetical protein
MMTTNQKPSPERLNWKMGEVSAINGKGVTVMQELQLEFKKGNRSASIAAEQERIILISKLLLPMVDFMARIYPKEKSKYSAFNKVFAVNIRDAVKGTYPELAIDYGKIALTKGSLPNAACPRASSVVAGKLLFSWTNNSGAGSARNADTVFVAAYCKEQNHWVYCLNSGTRDKGSCSLNVAAFSGKRMHTYIGFMSADGVRAASSVYTGMVKVL